MNQMVQTDAVIKSFIIISTVQYRLDSFNIIQCENCEKKYNIESISLLQYIHPTQFWMFFYAYVALLVNIG
jgi:hypothetical protein